MWKKHVSYLQLDNFVAISDDFLAFLSHFWHLILRLMPSWTSFMCLFKVEMSRNVFRHFWHFSSFSPSWTDLMCRCRCGLWPNDLSHMSHVNSFIFSWTILTCLFRSLLAEKYFPHYSHLFSLQLWIFRFGFFMNSFPQMSQVFEFIPSIFFVSFGSNIVIPFLSFIWYVIWKIKKESSKCEELTLLLHSYVTKLFT